MKTKYETSWTLFSYKFHKFPKHSLMFFTFRKLDYQAIPSTPLLNDFKFVALMLRVPVRTLYVGLRLIHPILILW